MSYKYGVKSPSQAMSNSSYFNPPWWTSISPYRTLKFESLTFWTCRVVQIGTWFLSFNVDPPWKSMKSHAVWGHFRVRHHCVAGSCFFSEVCGINWMEVSWYKTALNSLWAVVVRCISCWGNSCSFSIKTESETKWTKIFPIVICKYLVSISPRIPLY